MDQSHGRRASSAHGQRHQSKQGEDARDAWHTDTRVPIPARCEREPQPRLVQARPRGGYGPSGAGALGGVGGRGATAR
jgi:hypothetical protein